MFGAVHPAEPAPTSVDLLVEAAMVVTMDPARRVIRDGAVAIDDGRVVAVVSQAEAALTYRATRVVGGSAYVAIPGLVDSHVHISAEHLARSLTPDDVGSEWLKEWGLPLYTAIAPHEEYLAASLACIEMIRNGTTTFGEGGTTKAIDRVAQAIGESGLRGTIGLWTWDQVPELDALRTSPREAVAAAEGAIEQHHRTMNERIRVAAACISTDHCSDELMVGLRGVADKHETTFTFHHGATRAGVAGYVERHGRRPLVDMASKGLLGANVRTTHMVHVDDEEIELLANSGTSVAHCPQTSLRLGYGATSAGKFPEMIARGVAVGLGCDGVNTSDSLDLFRSIRLAAGLFKDAREDPSLIPAATALEMATLAGARSLGLLPHVGSLEVGKCGDVVLLNRETPQLTPLVNVVNALVYSADGRNVATVVVAGEVLMEDGRVLSVDEQQVFAEARLAAPELIGRAGLRPVETWLSE